MASSARDAGPPLLRRFIEQRLIVVTPGIGPVDNQPVDVQKRTVEVSQAFANGADHIVVGRSIRDAGSAARRGVPTRVYH